MRKLCTIFFILISSSLFGQDDFVLQLEDVPNQREIDGSRVTDLAEVLHDTTVFQIDSMLIQLEDSVGYQVAVVCVDSVGNQHARTFATDLFNHWGIGDAEKDNGLLIFLTMDIRQVDFITGRGTEGVLTDAECDHIQRNYMVPYFREGDYDQGMWQGVWRSKAQLQDQSAVDYLDLISDDPSASEDSEYSSESNESNYQPGLIERIYDTEWGFPIVFFIGLGSLIAAIPTLIWLIMLLVAFSSNKDPYWKFKRIWLMDHWLIAIALPLPMLAVVPITKMLKSHWRKKLEGDRDEPKLSKDGKLMRKLNFEEHDIVLSKGLIKPQAAKSKRIDIWATEGLDEVQVHKFERQWSIWKGKYNIDHGKLYYKYSQCPECKYKTYEFKSMRDTKGNKYVVTYACDNCEYTHSEEKERSKISFDSSSSSSKKGYSYKPSSIFKRSKSSSSSSSSGGSSSSSSGSSYGGGSSRGGGSSNKW